MAAHVLARCLCGRVESKLWLAPPETKKPLCHCGSCRAGTGVLFLTVLPLSAGRPSFVDQLNKYASSEKVERYFCGTCGSHVLCHVLADDSWDLCTGAVDKILNGGDSLSEYISGHEFLGDTVDGGLGICMTNANGSPLDLFLQGPDQTAILPSDLFSRLEHISRERAGVAGVHTDEYLHASCHCGGVKYRVSRPGPSSDLFSAPWPDLIVPSATGHAENRDDVKWWLTKSDAGTRYRAGTCACRSCRLASGVPVQTWSFIPLVNIEQPNGSAFDFSSGTLKQYNSSDGVYREFCSVCGSSAFWHCDARPELIDVSVGLLRAPEGARAEGWLDWWTDRVSFREDALDQSLVAELEKGLAVLKY